MKRTAVIGIALVSLLSGCVAYVPEHQSHGYYGYRDYGYRDRDRDGVRNRYDRDRDGDRVPNRYDRYPNNPRWY